MDSGGFHSPRTAESNFKNPLSLNRVLVTAHMCGDTSSLPWENEGETSQQRTVTTPIPNSGVMLLLLTAQHSQADSTTRTCEEGVRRDPPLFKNTSASCVFLPRRCFTSACSSDECEKLQIPSRAPLRFSLSHQDKLCTLLTIFCTLALFSHDYLRILMLASLQANNCSMFAYGRSFSTCSAFIFLFPVPATCVSTTIKQGDAYSYVFPTKFIQSQEEGRV